jgi:autotransporter-associated beta strand protein
LRFSLLSIVGLSACGDNAAEAPRDAAAPDAAAPDAAVVAMPPPDLGFVDSVPVPDGPSFVDAYKTNVTANMSSPSNAVLALLGGFGLLWTPGATWDGGTPTPRGAPILALNIQSSVDITTRRSQAQADAAYFDDRRNQSYSVISGLGALAPLYYAAAGATTAITTIPGDATTVPYNDTGTGGGVTTASLGNVVALVNLLRGSFSSTTPAKNYFLYPRPWRQSTDVVVVPALVPVESATPASDSGFTSGHTNAAYLAALALAYAIPERFQELVLRASEVGDNRIVAGMHSPLDVMGGRMMATALAAAILADPDNAAAKAAAYAQAHTYLELTTATTDATLFAYAHRDPRSDPWADSAANRSAFVQRLTYSFAPIAATTAAVPVPRSAEVLLETRLPYLDAAQRRVVLRTTGIASGYPVLDDPEGWGRLDLAAAADGYRVFTGDVVVTMDAALGGYHAADHWRNDITGTGKLTKRGSGTLTLDGTSSYRGGTQLEAGSLVAASTTAFGSGDVYLAGGTLVSDAPGALVIGGAYAQRTGATLELDLGAGGRGALSIAGAAILAGGALHVRFAAGFTPSPGDTLPVISSKARTGQFETILVDGFTATPIYTDAGVR